LKNQAVTIQAWINPDKPKSVKISCDGPFKRALKLCEEWHCHLLHVASETVELLEFSLARYLLSYLDRFVVDFGEQKLIMTS
jgi:hypothetical protein